MKKTYAISVEVEVEADTLEDARTIVLERMMSGASIGQAWLVGTLVRMPNGTWMEATR